MKKMQVFVIEADESKEEEMRKLIWKHLSPKVISEFNSIGEITSPYFGDAKLVEGLIEDLFILGPENSEELKQQFRMKRCVEVQKALLAITPKTNPDGAYALLNHVAHCAYCQTFVIKAFKAGGNRDVENYIIKKLKGKGT